MLIPQDISEKKFKKGMIGYNPEAVEEFLCQISESYEKIYAENNALKEEISKLTENIEEYKKREASFASADMLIKDAKKKAEDIVEQANREKSKIDYSYEQTKRSAEIFRAKAVALINAQLDIIKKYSELEDIDLKEIAVEKELSQDTAEIPAITDAE